MLAANDFLIDIFNISVLTLTVNSKYDADEESFEGEKTLTEDQLRPPRNAAQSNSRCDQKHKKIFQGTSNGLVPIVSPLSICSRSLCLELHRDVFENNLEKLDEVWRKNKLVQHKAGITLLMENGSSE